jgi:hypothetical protein
MIKEEDYTKVPIKAPPPPSYFLKIIASMKIIYPAIGPKNNVHKLITIDLPSNIIPGIRLNG